jgi:hypothetical protein
MTSHERPLNLPQAAHSALRFPALPLAAWPNRTAFAVGNRASVSDLIIVMPPDVSQVRDLINSTAIPDSASKSQAAWWPGYSR